MIQQLISGCVQLKKSKDRRVSKEHVEVLLGIFLDEDMLAVPVSSLYARLG